MKTYKKDFFLPVSMDTLWAVLQEPVKMDLVPQSESADYDIESPLKWSTSRFQPVSGQTVTYDAECVIDEASRSVLCTMYSPEKKLKLDCRLTLFHVGDLRTRMTVVYNIYYKFFNLKHLRARIAVALSEHKVFVDAIFHLQEKALELCAEKE